MTKGGKMIQKIIFGILLIVWLIIIFLFSSENAEKSTKTSDGFINSITNILNIEKPKDKEKVGHIVRKIAHFTEYFILGLILFLNLRLYPIDNKLIIGIILCMIYASSDEIHQIFVDGREAKILDVLIDTLGSATSLIILSLITKN